MSEQVDTELLLIDDYFTPFTEEDGQEMKSIQKSFIESYLKHKDNMSVEEWLPMELRLHLPDKTDEEINKISSDIITTIKVNEEKKQSLENAIKSGRSKESWFASETKKATSNMSTLEAAKYLQNLDNALATANDSLYRTIMTQNGTVNLNPNLDGFIAEQYHVQSFNLNAEATRSQYRAKVLEPGRQGYRKNSLDI